MKTIASRVGEPSDEDNGVASWRAKSATRRVPRDDDDDGTGRRKATT